MKILFTELARAELIDSIAYYEMDVPGLGETFKDEVASATMRIIVKIINIRTVEQCRQ